uniref:Uncharacterized protein n=1 Tax=Cannabis sativa TaxID=3483 RepID=A0A803Q4J8_CANSA
MMAILIYRKLDSVLEDQFEKSEKTEKLEKGTDGSKKEAAETIMKQARSAIIMNLADNGSKMKSGGRAT